ncbi:hypothetical protein DICPUDRAFT_157560 [Dictyostelium purpureum]|uniref:TFIID subunit TAF5 NTD2 domain-containing protein n=1 Tax=Dictyostelium purpureum TaxID=5786 RepID=F0ZZF6_DICPU|nr:uncharacterized protein DICPUDRAFT_157560 [Dictyostelium purpureum]EGC30678.1 hypothetical protein DICPUDRAFT_157560 [Dictyostelium purpureum]|eukprot:XP_003292803.1 hypothetical protein DICPUDRAFT_157560 [Dictyostelium purpureum]
MSSTPPQPQPTQTNNVNTTNPTLSTTSPITAPTTNTPSLTSPPTPTIAITNASASPLTNNTAPNTLSNTTGSAIPINSTITINPVTASAAINPTTPISATQPQTPTGYIGSPPTNNLPSTPPTNSITAPISTSTLSPSANNSTSSTTNSGTSPTTTTANNSTSTPTTPSTTAATTNSTINSNKSPSTKDKSIDLAVLNYLKKRGYSNAEAILKQELNNNGTPLSPNNENLSEVIDDVETNDQELTQYLLMYNSSQKEILNPQNYLESYKKLRNWIHSSLDIYKNELLSILYPVFVHSYIDLITKGYPTQARELMEQIGPDHEEYFGDDLKLLRGISNTDHLKENELVDLFRNNRWNIKMCAYSFELLMSFLHQSNFILLLSIINQYIHINVSNLRPGFIDDEQYSISFQSEKDAGNLNSTPINYHSFKPDYEDEVLMNKEKQEQSEAPPPTTSGYIPKLKKKDKKKKEVRDERMQKSQSNVPIPILTERFENELMDDFTKCISLSSTHLPSICFYTIFNSYQGLNTIDISKDAALVAGGFSDSSVKIWNLKEMKEKQIKRQEQEQEQYERTQQQQQQQQQQQPSSHDDDDMNIDSNGLNHSTTNNFASSASNASSAQNGISPNKSMNNSITNKLLKASNNERESDFNSFLGHSGPVYGCSFSPDSQYLLSCSEDTTARLWSMETMSNLVCYKGHNFPVWDVSFSPFGYYFATASHDRTARLWTTNYISPLRIFTGHLSDCNTVKFHPNINYLATGSNDKSARLWEIQTGKCVRIFMGHRAPIYSLAFSPDGRLLATAGEDTSVILWDLSTGKKVKKMDGHTKCVYSLDFSQDGSILASGSSDCTVRLWDVKKAFNNSISTQTSINDEAIRNANKRKSIKSKLFSEELIETYPTKQTPVYTVSFSRRNLLLASGAFNTLTAFDKF